MAWVDPKLAVVGARVSTEDIAQPYPAGGLPVASRDLQRSLDVHTDSLRIFSLALDNLSITG
jgi:hypothetical protein